MRSGRGVWWAMPLCLAVSLTGLVHLPTDYRDRNQALALQRHGEWITATDVQVDVRYGQYRSGREGFVEGVRVHLDGTRTPVPLGNLYASRDEPMLTGGSDGWQRPTSATSYVPPLTLRIRRDGTGEVTAAMAKVDYDYWTVDNVDVEIGLALSVAGLVGAVALFSGNLVRRRVGQRGRGARAGLTPASRGRGGGDRL